MTDAEILVAVQAEIGLQSRGELEHFLTCDGCYLFDYGGGPVLCRAFEIEFRGYVPRERTPAEQERLDAWAAIWAPMIRQATRRVASPGDWPEGCRCLLRGDVRSAPSGCPAHPGVLAS